MQEQKTIVGATLAGVLALGLVGQALGAEAKEGEKCDGVSKAGKNDCQTVASACAGSSKEDGDPSAFLYLPKGTCEKIMGGNLTPKG